MKNLNLTFYFAIIALFFMHGNMYAQTPGGNFDLSPWKLQGLDSRGTNRKTIQGSTLERGYKDQWFYATSSVNMYFKCPSNGGTTPGTKYPRVELRQTGRGANWKMIDHKTHQLTARCRVVNAPSQKPHIIIGQIHGHEKNSELLKIRWTGYKPGKCYVEARFQRNDREGAEYAVKLAQNLSLNDPIDYKIVMRNGKVTVTINGRSASQTYTTRYYGTTDRYYFKAGNYLNYTSRNGNDYSRVKFNKLDLAHPSSRRIGESTPMVSGDVIKLGNPLALHVYPNPTDGAATITFNLLQKTNVHITILDMMGKEVRQQAQLLDRVGLQEVSLSLTGLPSGVYLIRVSTPFEQSLRQVVLSN